MARYRRAPGLVMHWSGGDLFCFNPATTRRIAVTPDLIECLSNLDDWTSARELRSRVAGLGALSAVTRLLGSMCQRGLVEQQRAPLDWPWAPWSPEASFFFFGTRGGVYPADPLRYDAALQRKARHSPPPPPTKTVRGARRRLPPPRPLGSLAEALRDRRTWRNFAPAPLAEQDLATLLQSTWGVQRWAAVRGQGRVALKTSPSGGARHSIEAYALVRNVAGIAPGAYHYDAATHELVDLRHRVTRAHFERVLVHQHYYRDAAVLIVMSAVFGRAMWRYPFGRALRTILAEAGHLAQTFCLAATSLGLAPFTVMAMDEQAAERMMGIDGVSEAALYVVGAGSRSIAHASQPGRMPGGRRR